MISVMGIPSFSNLLDLFPFFSILFLSSRQSQLIVLIVKKKYYYSSCQPSGFELFLVLIVFFSHTVVLGSLFSFPVFYFYFLNAFLMVSSFTFFC
jgi:hypothetical protein